MLSSGCWDGKRDAGNSLLPLDKIRKISKPSAQWKPVSIDFDDIALIKPVHFSNICSTLLWCRSLIRRILSLRWNNSSINKHVATSGSGMIPLHYITWICQIHAERNDEKAKAVPNEVNKEGTISIKFIWSGVSVAFKRNKHKYRMELC